VSIRTLYVGLGSMAIAACGLIGIAHAQSDPPQPIPQTSTTVDSQPASSYPVGLNGEAPAPVGPNGKPIPAYPAPGDPVNCNGPIGQEGTVCSATIADP
jgi:hypothetical protein